MTDKNKKRLFIAVLLSCLALIAGYGLTNMFSNLLDPKEQVWIDSETTRELERHRTSRELFGYDNFSWAEIDAFRAAEELPSLIKESQIAINKIVEGKKSAEAKYHEALSTIEKARFFGQEEKVEFAEQTVRFAANITEAAEFVLVTYGELDSAIILQEQLQEKVELISQDPEVKAKYEIDPRFLLAKNSSEALSFWIEHLVVGMDELSKQVQELMAQGLQTENG